MKAAPDSIDVRFEGAIGSFQLDVAFEAPMRGITAIFGPSGCGKTTLLRCIAGLRRMPGRLAVGGDVWQDDGSGAFRKPYERAVGYVFQEASLFPHLSVRKNLLYGSRRRLGSDAVPRLALDEVTDLLAVRTLLDRSPASLSGGERQRVAIGRALLSQPQVLLMDEPLAGLDQAAREEILPYLEAMHQSLLMPILYVSHDLREVARLADTMVVIEAGRQRHSGPLGEILERLDLDLGASEFEAGVVLRAQVAHIDTRYKMARLDHHGQTISVPDLGLSAGEEVRLRIRARDVALATARPDAISVRNILAGSVLELSGNPETPFAEVLVDIGGGRLRARITRDAAEDLDLQPGAAVFALVKSISLDRPARGDRRLANPPSG